MSTGALKKGVTAMKFEQSVIINQPVEEVWKFVSTIENAPKWDRGVIATRQTSEGPIGVGTTVQTTRQLLGRQRTGNYVVSEYEPNKKIALTASLGPFQGQVRLAFESVSGGTRFTQSGEMENTSGLWNLITPLLVLMLARDAQADVANVKRILETEEMH